MSNEVKTGAHYGTVSVETVKANAETFRKGPQMTPRPTVPSAAAAAAEEKLIHDLAEAFLRWPLPDSVCADLCATKQGPGRVGTNLLSFIEARQMFAEIVIPKLGATAEDAARMIEKKSADHWADNGRIDHETGTQEPEAVVEYCQTLDELADEVRALTAQPTAPQPTAREMRLEAALEDSIKIVENMDRAHNEIMEGNYHCSCGDDPEGVCVRCNKSTRLSVLAARYVQLADRVINGPDEALTAYRSSQPVSVAPTAPQGGSK